MKAPLIFFSLILLQINKFNPAISITRQSNWMSGKCFYFYIHLPKIIETGIPVYVNEAKAGKVSEVKIIVSEGDTNFLAKLEFDKSLCVRKDDSVFFIQMSLMTLDK
jgi:hypothetical protein